MSSSKQTKKAPSISGQGATASTKRSSIAKNTVMKQPTYLRFGAGRADGSLTVVGRQLLTNVTTTGVDNQLFSANGATVDTINSILIGPDTLNSRVALLSRNFSRYMFTHLRFHYITRVATTQAGGGVLAVIEDGDVLGFATANYAAACSSQMSQLFTFREDCVVDVTCNVDREPLYTEVDQASLAGQRQTVQYTLLGYPDATSIGAVNHGHIWIEYTLELMQPSTDYGFSVAIGDPVFRAFVREVGALIESRRQETPTFHVDVNFLRDAITRFKR